MLDRMLKLSFFVLQILSGIPTQSQDLAPPPPMSTFGDTIVASNPFDDTPPTMQHSHQNGMMNHHMPHPPHHPMRTPIGKYCIQYARVAHVSREIRSFY